MANRLAAASSPYLQQHADNPVHWWEWTEAAFDEARRRDVPVLLSVGYAACHWCHVMAHESFADPVIAAQMNEHFVCIKVDREERPDIDAIYMNATVAMTGQGGWPMTCFLTADGQPFYCGTYYPPQPRGGMPGFGQLMAAITDTWRTRRDEIDRVGGQITEHLRANAAALPAAGVPIGDDLFDRAVEAILADEDREAGGFGGAPKFPPSAVLEALIRYDERRGAGTTAALPVVFRAAEAMARGGIYDQLAGGFARYSVDAGWVVPHFEKMLYDNAQLLRVYAHLARRTGNRLAVRITEETVDFLQRDLLATGGFAASLDADAAGVEGSTYVWTPAQLREALGEADGAWAAELFTVTESGTFEADTSVLQLPADPDDPDRWQRVRRRLLDARAEREQPPRDDKVVAAWNGMAITALVEAGLALGRPGWIDLATQVAEEMLSRHLVDGRLRRTSLAGSVGEVPGMLDDHAALATGLLTLHQATGAQRHRDGALRLIDAAVEIFGDPTEPGSWFDAPDDGSALISRPRDPVDGATPAGGSLLAEALLTASMLAPAATAGRYLQLLEATLERSAILLDRLPRSAGHWLAVQLGRAGGPLHVTAATAELLEAARRSVPGGAAVIGRPAEGQPPGTAMVCRGTVCSMPVTDPAELRALIGGEGTPQVAG